jgi:predicted unusual protein kinase regulating ubiquinone biosynthesis (AarF/ABC1/UbiB family)
VFPGIDIGPLVTELQERAAEELDYRLEGRTQQAFADAFAEDPEILVPNVVHATETVLVTEWMESTGSLAKVIADGTPEERDHYGDLLVRFTLGAPARTGMLHADPHPGNFRTLPRPDGSPGRLGVLDFGAVSRLPEGTFPPAMGRLIRTAMQGDADALLAGLRAEGFIRDGIRVDAQVLLDYLLPFVEPLAEERFRFTRAWMQGQFERLNNAKDPGYTLAVKLNLPPSYLLIHRTWLGGIGLLSQLEAEVPFRAILEENLPGFVDDGVA